MSEWASRWQGIRDCHVHMGSIAEEASILQLVETTGVVQMNLLSILNPAEGTGFCQSLLMKARYPEMFYVFPGLNFADRLYPGRASVPPLAQQVDAYLAAGCDGIKMIDKPTQRRRLNVPVTDPYYADYWARAEELGVPILWHVNDPEEFWDSAKLPAWARELSWGYGPDDAQKEPLYAEVDEVLARHPGLRVIFPHFYFLSADLPRMGAFLETHPSVSIDLTPGIEMLYNLSFDVPASRDFFVKYADQILYGTDLAGRQTQEEGRYRAGIVYRWLETEDTYRIPLGTDFLLGKPEEGEIRGLALPDDVLARIYCDNFVRYVGAQPKPLNASEAVELCGSLAAVAESISGKPAGETEAAQVAKALAG